MDHSSLLRPLLRVLSTWTCYRSGSDHNTGHLAGLDTLPTKWKEAHYQRAAREFLGDQFGLSDRTNATPKMASLTASRSTNSIK